MKIASFFVLLTLLIFQAGVCLSAKIEIVRNPYRAGSHDLGEYFREHEGFFAATIAHYPSLESIFEDEPLDREGFRIGEHFDYRKNGHLSWTLETKSGPCLSELRHNLTLDDFVLKISGPIEKGDYEDYLAIAQRAYDDDDEAPCPLTLLIDSSGGDLDAAMKIGRRVRAENRAVLVGNRMSCISACMFIFMAAVRDGSEGSYSVGFAFDDAVLGMHLPYWENLTESRRQDLSRLAYWVPQTLYQSIGYEWRRVMNYAQRVSGSSGYASILLHSQSLKPGEFYLIESLVERRALNINNVFGYRPDRDAGSARSLAIVGRQPQPPLSAIESCLYFFVDSSSLEAERDFTLLGQFSRFYDIADHRVHVAYDPFQQKICAVVQASGQTGGFLFQAFYPDGGSYDWAAEFRTKNMVERLAASARQVTDAFADYVLPDSTAADVLASISKELDEPISAEDDDAAHGHESERAIEWDVFRKLHGDAYSYEAGGAWRGRYMFSQRVERRNEETGLIVDGQRITALELGNLIFFIALHDLYYAEQGTAEDSIFAGFWAGFGEIERPEPFDRTSNFLLSPDCGTASSICSTVAGRLEGGVLWFAYR